MSVLFDDDEEREYPYLKLGKNNNYTANVIVVDLKPKIVFWHKDKSRNYNECEGEHCEYCQQPEKYKKIKYRRILVQDFNTKIHYTFDLTNKNWSILRDIIEREKLDYSRSPLTLLADKSEGLIDASFFSEKLSERDKKFAEAKVAIQNMKNKKQHQESEDDFDFDE